MIDALRINRIPIATEYLIDAMIQEAATRILADIEYRRSLRFDCQHSILKFISDVKQGVQAGNKYEYYFYCKRCASNMIIETSLANLSFTDEVIFDDLDLIANVMLVN